MSCTYICRSIVAIVTVASIAVELLRETLAVELETLRLFAVAWMPSRLFIWRRTSLSTRGRSLVTRSR